MRKDHQWKLGLRLSCWDRLQPHDAFMQICAVPVLFFVAQLMNVWMILQVSSTTEFLTALQGLLTVQAEGKTFCQPLAPNPVVVEQQTYTTPLQHANPATSFRLLQHYCWHCQV